MRGVQGNIPYEMGEHRMATGMATTPSDGELLAAFAASRAEVSFEELVQRHGAMVFNTCVRSLDSASDAEDAAQAVFLVLANKAGSLRNCANVAGWLHDVARNVCANAHKASRLRRIREQEAARMVGTETHDAEWERQKEHLDDDLAALPEKYRLPLILAHLEGHSIEECAALLSVSPGALGMRLSRGRELLRERIARRGMVLGAAALADLLSNNTLAAELPAAFMAKTTSAAYAAAAGHTMAGEVANAKAAALAEGALKMLMMAKLKAAAVVAVVVCAVGSGAGITAWRALAEEDGKAATEVLPAAPKTRLTASLALAKKKVAQGEAIVLTLSLQNDSDSKLMLSDGPLFGLWDVELEDFGRRGVEDDWRVTYRGGERANAPVELAPHAKLEIRITLDKDWRVYQNGSDRDSIAPGKYRVRVRRGPFPPKPMPPGYYWEDVRTQACNLEITDAPIHDDAERVLEARVVKVEEIRGNFPGSGAFITIDKGADSGVYSELELDVWRDGKRINRISGFRDVAAATATGRSLNWGETHSAWRLAIKAGDIVKGRMSKPAETVRGLQLQLLPFFEDTVLKSGDKSTTVRNVNLRLRNASAQPIKLDQYLSHLRHLHVSVKGPDGENIKVIRRESMQRLLTPTAADFPALAPDQSLSPALGDLGVEFAFLKPGQYRVQLVYVNPPKAPLLNEGIEKTAAIGANLAAGCWQGEVVSNERILEVLAETK